MDLEKLIISNPHWEKNFFYEYEFERQPLKLLKKEIERSRLIRLVIGPRRVGKTVMLKQLINYLIKKTDRKNILYVLLENEKEELYKIITQWSKEMNVDLRRKTYIFLDEIQYINNWGRQVKFLYDSFPKMHIVLSGSASAVIRKGSESLAGRIIEHFIPVLSFEEFLMFSKRPTIKSWKLYREYMFKQLPEIAMGEDPKEYIRSIVNKVIREDMRILFDAPNFELAESILKIVFKNPGQIIDYADLGNELGVDRNTISKYMNAFCNSYIFRKLYSYSKNARKVEKRKKKFYPFYTSLINYIKPFLPKEGLLLETEVAEKLRAKFYYREREKEIDIILPKCLFGIEVKTGKIIKRQTIKTLIEADWLKKKILVCKPDSKIFVKGVKIIFPNMLNTVLQDCNKHAEYI